MEIFFIIIFGLCIGSFLNVCIYRISREESIVFPPSHCTKCGYKLKVCDLVPVISYIFLKGKCRECKERISIKYPLIEILNTVICIIIYLNYGLGLEFVKFNLFASLMIVIAVIDFETNFVFNSTIVFGVVTGVIFLAINWITTKKLPWSYIIGIAIGFLIIWSIVILSGGMGEGDIDIALICGLFLGLEGTVVTLFIAFVSAGIIAIFLMLLKFKDRKSEMAFGPYLAFAGIISIIYAERIFELYVSVL